MLFLASGASSYITGIALGVTGGIFDGWANQGAALFFLSLARVLFSSSIALSLCSHIGYTFALNRLADNHAGFVFPRFVSSVFKCSYERWYIMSIRC